MVATRRKRQLVPLSRGEWALMNVCWRLGKATAREIHEASPEGSRREYRTTKTMLDRMEAKGWLDVTRVGPVRVYAPAVPRSRAIGPAVREFLGQVLGGSLEPLFVHLVDEELTDEDLAALRRLVEAKEREKKRPGGKGGGKR